jgi:asparagine synthase (glutamine-hydrolysing)
MSALTGSYIWDGPPTSAATLATLAAASRPAGPDASGTATPAPGVTLQVHRRYFDRRSRTERQPYSFAGGSVLTWDGRLDNREDLLLTLRPALGADRSDAALVAAAYQCWGAESFRRLVGDWSLVLWDAAQHALVLARDYMGNRPLYYLAHPGGLTWATCQLALVAAYPRETEPDLSYIAGTLTTGAPAATTPFQNVRPLPAGHTLIAPAQHRPPRRYWTFTPAVIRYADPRAYTEQLRALLVEAVRVRLRATRPVWSHLSGGWDSSSLVCLGHALIEDGRVEAPAIRPVSVVCSASPESDESLYITAVEEWCGLTSVRREYAGSPTCAELLHRPHPDTRVPRLEVEAPVRDAGDTIVLSGELGDLTMIAGSSHRISLLEPLHAGRPWTTLRLCFQRARDRRRPLLTTLGQLALLAYAPASMQRFLALRHVLPGRPTLQEDDAAAQRGVTPALRAHVPPLPTAAAYPSARDFPYLKRWFVHALYGCAAQGVLTSSDLTPDIWLTFPYGHRPLVEYMLATPQLAYWEPCTYRRGMQRALDGLLPPLLLQRNTKGEPAAVLARAKRDEADDLAAAAVLQDVAQWELVRRGYVVPAVLDHDLAAVRAGAEPSAFLSRCVSMETWLRARRPTPPLVAAASHRPAAPTRAPATPARA